jgi:hypothetical protein
VRRFRRVARPKRKLPAGFQARLAGAALRGARKAAENGRCAAAELLFAFGGGDLRAAASRARSPGAAIKALEAGIEHADAARAIVDCRERERAARQSVPNAGAAITDAPTTRPG